MIDRRCGAWLRTFVLPVVLAGAVSTISARGPVALPSVKAIAGAMPVLLVQEEGQSRPEGDAQGADHRQAMPLAELNEALAAARARLEQLNRAAEALAGAAALRTELAAKEEENRALLAEVQILRTRREEWRSAEAAAQAEIAGLTQALDEAIAETKRLDGALAAERWQNAQLSNSLDRARNEQETAQAGTEALRAELTAQAADLEARLDDARNEIERVRGQLRATAVRLSEVNGALSAAEQERDAALGELDEERSAAEQLNAALAAADADLKEANAANRTLEARLAGLEEAAMLATDAAKQNLLAVESQIAALNSTLAEAELAADVEKIGVAASAEAVPAASAERPFGEESDEPAPAARRSEPGDGALATVALSEPAVAHAPKSLDEMVAALPVESRIQMQSLLADLDAQVDPEGIKLTVPGGELFQVNGREVRDTAHESLAKVAELINLYKSQPVLIIGHTDAIGAPDYNQTLSERRAGLVKQFFVDHFDVEAARLLTQGMGEQDPIASNATAAGRRANRRVEVLILN